MIRSCHNGVSQHRDRLQMRGWRKHTPTASEKSGPLTDCASHTTVSHATAANMVKRTEDITAAVTRKPAVEVSEPNHLPKHTLAEWLGWLAAVCVVGWVSIGDCRLSLWLEGSRGRGMAL